MNRTHHLKEAMPSIIEAANYSPPVEIVVLDYNSSDGLEEYIASLKSTKLAEGNEITYIKYDKNKYYHMAHARNLVSLAAKGEYLVETCVEVYLNKDFFSKIREAISQSNLKWYKFHHRVMPGIIVIQKAEFIKAGGYDERFELYGPEDQELNNRLSRRGLEFGIIDKSCLTPFTNPDDEKTQNYRFKITKREMVERMMPYYEENINNKAVEANKGVIWGQR